MMTARRTSKGSNKKHSISPPLRISERQLKKPDKRRADAAVYYNSHAKKSSFIATSDDEELEEDEEGGSDVTFNENNGKFRRGNRGSGGEIVIH